MLGHGKRMIARHALALALLLQAHSALADPLTWAPGQWAIHPDHVAEMAKVSDVPPEEMDEFIRTFSCGGEANERIRIFDEGTRYESRSGFGDDEWASVSDITQVTPRSFAVQYEGEERMMPNGEPQVWHMVFVDEDTFMWVMGPTLRERYGTVPYFRTRCRTDIS